MKWEDHDFRLFRGGFEVPRRHSRRDAELADASVGLELRQAVRARNTDFGVIALWVAIKPRETDSFS